jgi:acid phosphatase (class A)
MKTIQVLAMSFFIICVNISFAQDSALPYPHEYYSALETFDRSATKAGSDLDLKKFPYDASAAEKRLSLKPYYLEGTTLGDFKIPDPPANSSVQTRAELNYLLRLQNQRSPFDIQSSLAMAGIFYNPRITPADSSYAAYRKNLFHVGRSLGSWFNPESLPRTANLMANVWRDASFFIWGLKYKYLRIRPYVLEPRIDNLEETNWAAYPSGHAANSYINAYIFQELSPSNRDIFLRDAYDMAHSREILGVHYPSDSEAARLFARQFVDRLLSNKKFLADLETARKEWQQKPLEDFAQPVEVGAVKSAAGASCGKPKTASTCAQKCQ